MEVSILSPQQPYPSQTMGQQLSLISSFCHCHVVPPSYAVLPYTEKPLKVEVVVDPSKVAAAPAAAPKGAKAVKGAAAAGPAKGKGGRGATSAQGRGRGRGAKREARPKKTVEDLDAEMEDYNKQASTDAPAS